VQFKMRNYNSNCKNFINPHRLVVAPEKSQSQDDGRKCIKPDKCEAPVWFYRHRIIFSSMQRNENARK
jgi:hypothetical protein